MTINELRAKRNQAWEAAKAFVATKRDKDGLLSAEDALCFVHHGLQFVLETESFFQIHRLITPSFDVL